MHILVLSQYFWPENFRINDLVAGLVQRGHRVTVLTGQPNYPEGRFFDGYGYLRLGEQQYQGARVLRVPILPRVRGRAVHLALNYLSFVLSAGLLAPLRCRERYDVCFVFEPSPVTVALPAILLRALFKLPVLFWVQDLWPESLEATGAVRNRWILDRIAGLVRFIYRRCDRILVTSPAFRRSVEELGGAPAAIRYFPQSAEEVFLHAAPDAPVQALDAVPPGFWVMFAGNIGAAQDFETVMSAAQRLKQHQDIHWLIVGDGRMRAWAEATVCELGLCANVHFLGRHPLEAMPAFFARADALLVTLRKEPIFALTIPAKIQAYLACGRPVVAGLDGVGAEIIAEAGAGIACPAQDPDRLAQAVLDMYHTPREERERMGQRGRRYYEANFDRDMLLDKLEIWMNEVRRVPAQVPA